jgi:hypothetical protein
MMILGIKTCVNFTYAFMKYNGTLISRMFGYGCEEFPKDSSPEAMNFCQVGSPQYPVCHPQFGVDCDYIDMTFLDGHAKDTPSSYKHSSGSLQSGSDSLGAPTIAAGVTLLYAFAQIANQKIALYRHHQKIEQAQTSIVEKIRPQ